MHDVIVPEADHAVAAAPDLQGAGGVFVRLLRVLAAVEFIGGREVLPGCRSSALCIEIRECKLPVFPREIAYPHAPPEGRRELGTAEITDDDNLRVCR
jgi:hypothetical protein